MTERRFQAKAIEKHMQKHFPNCPQVHRDEIVRRVTERTWKDATIGRAVGITVTNHVRHRLTDYEQLMKQHGLTREEARFVEAGTVKEICRSWQAVNVGGERVGRRVEARGFPCLVFRFSDADSRLIDHCGVTDTNAFHTCDPSVVPAIVGIHRKDGHKQMW